MARWLSELSDVGGHDGHGAAATLFDAERGGEVVSVPAAMVLRCLSFAPRYSYGIHHHFTRLLLHRQLQFQDN